MVYLTWYVDMCHGVSNMVRGHVSLCICVCIEMMATEAVYFAHSTHGFATP